MTEMVRGRLVRRLIDDVMFANCYSGNSRLSRSPVTHSSSASSSSPEQVEVKFESSKTADSDSRASPTQVSD